MIKLTVYVKKSSDYLGQFWSKWVEKVCYFNPSYIISFEESLGVPKNLNEGCVNTAPCNTIISVNYGNQDRVYYVKETPDQIEKLIKRENKK